MPVFLIGFESDDKKAGLNIINATIWVNDLKGANNLWEFMD